MTHGLFLPDANVKASMPGQNVVLLNHFGGVPSAYVRNVAESQRSWATDLRTHVVLPTLSDDPRTNLRAVVLDERARAQASPEAPPHAVLDAARAQGWTVIMLGARPTRWRIDHSAPHSERLPDPQEAFQSWGIDRAPLFDGADFDGNAEVHDEAVLAEARRLLYEHSGLFVWINLLSCRDLDAACLHSMYSSYDQAKAESTASSYALPKRLAEAVVKAYDVRRVPTCVPDHAKTRVGSVPLAHVEYLTLLDHAWEVLMRQETRACGFLLEALHARAVSSVAVTATRVLSLGEHDVRGGTNPTSIGCETFWCSLLAASSVSSNLVSTQRVALADLLRDFVEAACTPSASPRPSRSLSSSSSHVTVVHGKTQALVRVVCVVRERSYACTLHENALLSVHDLDSDPHQTTDVRSTLQHMHSDLWQALRDAWPSLPPRSPLRPSVSSPPSPPSRSHLTPLEDRTSPLPASVPPSLPPPPPPVQVAVSLPSSTSPAPRSGLSNAFFSHPSSVPVPPVDATPVPEEHRSALRFGDATRSVPSSGAANTTVSSSGISRPRAPSVRAKESRLNAMHR